MTNLTKVKYIISEKLNKLYAKKLRLTEQGWGTQWPQFQTWANTFSSTASNHQNTCQFLEKRYNALYAKLMSLGGSTGVPNTPQGVQHAIMLTYKLSFIASWITFGCQAGFAGCCGISTPITEGTLPQIPQQILSLADPLAISQVQQLAKDHVQAFADQN